MIEHCNMLVEFWQISYPRISYIPYNPESVLHFPYIQQELCGFYQSWGFLDYYSNSAITDCLTLVTKNQTGHKHIMPVQTLLRLEPVQMLLAVLPKFALLSLFYIFECFYFLFLILLPHKLDRIYIKLIFLQLLFLCAVLLI